MTQSERTRLIEKYIEENSPMGMSALSKETGVSPDTIRRCLKGLSINSGNRDKIDVAIQPEPKSKKRAG